MMGGSELKDLPAMLLALMNSAQQSNKLNSSESFKVFMEVSYMYLQNGNLRFNCMCVMEFMKCDVKRCMVLHGARGMQHGARGIQHGARGMQHGARGIQHGARGMQHGARGIQHGAREMQHGAREIQHGTRRMQHGARGIQHGTRRIQHGARGI